MHTADHQSTGNIYLDTKENDHLVWVDFTHD